MDKEKLQSIVETGEDQKTEFKRSVSDIAVVVTSFANAEGGKLIIGLEDDGSRVPGLEKWNLNDKRSDVQDEINTVEGVLNTNIEAVDGLLVVDVDGNKDAVNKAPSGYYIRQDTVDQSMSHDQIRALMEESGDINFEQVECRRFQYPEDVDPNAVDKFQERAKISDEEVENDSMLRHLGLAHSKEGKIEVNNAGAILFGVNPERFVPNSGIQCISFESEDDDIEWVEKKEINSPLILAVFEAINFIHSNTRSKRRVKDTGRETVNQYPTNALREALVNAVVHRDYHNQRQKTQVKVYPNRVEISNPGGLIGNMSIDDLWEDESIQRNPTIASVMQRMELAEEMGTGIQRITKEMTDRNYPKPDFVDNGKFVVNLIGREMPQDLNQRQRRAIRHLYFSEKITSSDYQEIVNGEISRKTVLRDLNNLIEKGWIERRGEGSDTHYILNENR
ncbi:MAG: ATP-binding protein [Candidatus Nanohalobium sp.]